MARLWRLSDEHRQTEGSSCCVPLERWYCACRRPRLSLRAREIETRGGSYPKPFRYDLCDTELRLRVIRSAGVEALSGSQVNVGANDLGRSEEHTSELQSLMRTSYAVFCLKKKTTNIQLHNMLHTPV